MVIDSMALLRHVERSHTGVSYTPLDFMPTNLFFYNISAADAILAGDLVEEHHDLMGPRRSAIDCKAGVPSAKSIST